MNDLRGYIERWVDGEIKLQEKGLFKPDHPMITKENRDYWIEYYYQLNFKEDKNGKEAR